MVSVGPRGLSDRPTDRAVMVLAGRYTAVVDRIDRGVAVLVLREDGDPLGEFAVPPDDLPGSARHPEAVLTVEVAAGRLVAFEHDR